MSAASNILATALKKLIDAGGALQSSKFTASQRYELVNYATRTSAVRKEARGAGQAFVITELEVVQLTYTQLRPVAPEAVPADIPNRSQNIAMRRDSKAGERRMDAYHLVLKPIGAGATWANGTGTGLDLGIHAAVTGLAALPVSKDDPWSSDAPLWLVENQANFDDLSWIPQDATGSVAYYGGILDGRLLSWLSARRRHAGLILFPDYDGVGLLQFARLAATPANADVKFWLMPDWLSLLERFGNTRVWMNTLPHFKEAAAGLADLTHSCALHQVTALMNAMQRKGLALEQEAAWLRGV